MLSDIRINNKIMIKEIDKAIAYEILSLIGDDLLHMMSWGFSDPTIIEHGLQFKVRGLIHKGKVKVTCNKDNGLFDIQIIGKKDKVKYSIEDISLNQLINQIDLHVERVPNYREVLEKIYGLPPLKDNIDKDLK